MSEQPQQRSTEEVEAIKEDILTALETVIDPELGIDIVNLGLIYEVEFAEETGDTVIKMTLNHNGLSVSRCFNRTNPWCFKRYS